MIWIISLIFLIVIFIISLIYLYLRVFSQNTVTHEESKDNLKKVSIEVNIAPTKKGKKHKKSHKQMNTDSNSEEIHDSLKPVSSTESTMENQMDIEVIEEIEPVTLQSQQAGSYSGLEDVENPLINDDRKNIADLTNQIERFEEENIKLTGKLEEATEKLANYKEEVESLSTENKIIKSQITQLECSKTEIEEKLKKLENSHSDSLSKNVALEKKLAKNNVEYQNLKEQFIKCDKELKSEKEKLKNILIERDQTLKKYEDIFNQNKTDNANHVTMYSQYENKIEQLKGDNKQIKIETGNLNRMLTEKDDCLNKKIEELNQMRIALETISSEKTDLSTKYHEITEKFKKSEAHISSLEREKSDLSEDINSLRKEMSIRTEEKLQQTAVEFSQNLTTISELKKDINNLKVEIERKENESDKFTREMHDLLVKKDNEIRILENTKVDLLLEIDNLKKDVRLGHEKVKEITVDLDRRTSNVESLENEKEALEMKFSELKTSSREDQDIKKKLIELSAELKEKNNDISVLQDHKLNWLDEVKKLNEEIKRKKDESAEKIMKLQSMLNERENIIDQLRKQIIDKDAHMGNKQIEIKLEELTKDLEAKNIDLSVSQDKISVLLNENEKLNNDYVSLRDRFEFLEMKLNESDFTTQDVKQFLLCTDYASEDIIQPCFQPLEYDGASVDSSVQENLKSHINKLETEILNLQRKYFDLKNTSIASTESNHVRKPIENNFSQTQAVSIPPIADLSGIPVEKSPAHNILLESIEKLNAEISEQKLKNQDLQNSFTESFSEKNRLKAEFNQLLKNHEDLNAKYRTLAEEFVLIKNSSGDVKNENINCIENQLVKYQAENCQLKQQLDTYRETLERTETCLQNIQASVDQEENKWKVCLKSSEQEQERLEQKIDELLNQIEELKNQKQSDHLAMNSMEMPSIPNGSLSSETKKKRKRKNKKKKNKNRVTQP